MNPLNRHSYGLIACFALFAPLIHAQGSTASESIRWISSTQAEPWKEMPLEAIPTAEKDLRTAAIQLNDRNAYQQIDGFGGCFNDLGWQALLALDAPDR